MNKENQLVTNALRRFRAFLKFSSGMVVAILLLNCLVQADLLAHENAPPRPNIVLILCDDLGYADVGFNGSTDIATPSLDALAKNGTIFTSGYVVHPFCGPSRMGLLAGRYPHKFGAPFNLPPTGSGFDRFDNEGIPESETLLGTVLQDAGYFTGAIGKWHLGFSPQHHPNKRGFDDFYGFLGGGHQYFPEQYGPIYERQKKAGKTRFNEYITPLEHNGEVVKETEYMTDALSREAVRFVGEASKKQNPFFLYLSYNAPHAPLQAKQEDLDRFSHINDEKRKTYAAMVYAVDRGVSELVAALKDNEVFDNTLIVFLSDNGGKIGAGSNNAPLKMGKGSVCEGGFRVPMFFHWPDKVTAGQRFKYPVTALDFFPTFARLAGANVPADQELDGKDIWSSLVNNSNPRPGESIFALRHWNGFHNVGIRRDQWKALKRGPKSEWELYDLEHDIGEDIDLSDKHADVVNSMVAEAKQWGATHSRPRWFLNAKSESSWDDLEMPVYESTFLNDRGRQSSTNKKKGNPKTSPQLEKQEPILPKVMKQSPSDLTLEEWIEKERVKWEKNGWRWNLAKVKATFAEMDTDNNGLASGKERKTWYAKKAAEREKPNSQSTKSKQDLSQQI